MALGTVKRARVELDLLESAIRRDRSRQEVLSRYQRCVRALEDLAGMDAAAADERLSALQRQAVDADALYAADVVYASTIAASRG
jgi:phosphopantothenate synthetase